MEASNKYERPILTASDRRNWAFTYSRMALICRLTIALKGFCDLQFSKCTREELLAKVKDFLSDRMTVEKTGKSASVRIRVPPVWFEKQFAEKTSEVDEALAAMVELYELSRTLVKADRFL